MRKAAWIVFAPILIGATPAHSAPLTFNSTVIVSAQAGFITAQNITIDGGAFPGAF